MSSSDPLVSVIMPVRNGMPFVVEAVDSIRRQTWKHWELVVVDDRSTDGTRGYLAGIECPEIKVFKTPSSGVRAATDIGIRAARGELLALMDADDISLPTRIEAQVRFLKQNPGVVGVGTQVRFIADGVEGGAFRCPCDPKRILSALRLGRVALRNPSMMFRADAARRVFPIVQAPGPGFEFDFYLRLAAHGELANLDDELFVYRISRNSVSFSRVEEQLGDIAFAMACERARNTGAPEPDFEAFQRAWKTRPGWQRLATKLRALHQRCFRLAVIHRTRGRNIHAILCLASSALLYPPAVWYQLRRAFCVECAFGNIEREDYERGH